jgi:hypothetical protein
MIAVGGKMLWPHQAKAQGAPLDPLTAAEAALVETVGDILVPGAAAAGLAHYLAAQLRKPPADTLLIVRTLDVAPPYLNFYRAGLAALAETGVASQDPETALAALRSMMTGNPPGWSAAIPAPLFMFVLRSDAVDVTYGTPAGFQKLGVPYMAHIEPDPVW